MNHDAVSVQICLDAGLSEAQADVLLTRLKGAPAPQPTAQARYQRLQGWSKRGIESLCISLDIQQEQTGGGSKACAIAASLLRGIAEQHLNAPTQKPAQSVIDTIVSVLSPISELFPDGCPVFEWPHETTPTPAEVRELAEGIAAAIAAQPSVPEPLLREERDKGFSAGWDYGYKHGSKQGFSLGVCVSLAVVRSHDAATIWREIVTACGQQDLLHFVTHEEPEEWELAGFDKYAKAELGRGKPRKRKATQEPPIFIGIDLAENGLQIVRDAALEEAATLNEQWGQARTPDGGGNALRNAAVAIRELKSKPTQQEAK